MVLDQVIKAGFENGLFELSDDEMDDLLEEFYNGDDKVLQGEQLQAVVKKPHAVAANGKWPVKQKLECKAGATYAALVKCLLGKVGIYFLNSLSLLVLQNLSVR